jgi:2,4-dienoyl-CoA reductase (NADPH2)
LVNPRACHETELNYTPILQRKKRIAVVGAGPAGLACATVLAERGHQVDLYEAADRIGGQFNLARQIPGKEEFNETLRYFSRKIELTGVRLHMNTRVSHADFSAGMYEEVVLATGVIPRNPKIPGQNEGIARGQVLSYIDVLLHRKPVGRRVAVIGAGGIGFDICEFLVQEGASPSLHLNEWMKEWGITDPGYARGGITHAEITAPARHVTLLQRKASKPGAGLGKTTGWIHRAVLKTKQVVMLPGVNYERISAQGLHISHGGKRERPELIAVDQIILCAGQEPLRELQAPLVAAGIKVHLVGGAEVAAELDAKRAINQATRLAATL